MKRALIVAAILIIGAGFIVWAASTDTSPRPESATPNPSTEQACTTDAMMCPDGTAVGRTGPNCSFAPCPQATSSEEVEANPLPAPQDGSQLDMGVGDGSLPQASGQACIREGGTWDPQYEECVGVRPAQCQTIGGVYNECASACRHNPEAEVCTLQCVQVCQM